MRSQGRFSRRELLSMDAARILIVDDHAVFRRGVRAILEEQQGWQVVAEASDGRTAIELARLHQPDIVILDIGMPEMNGLEAMRQILRESPVSEILILTLHDSEELAGQVLKLGARGYLVKSDAAKDLVFAVEALRQGSAFFTPKVSSMVLNGYLNAQRQAKDTHNHNRGLTAREREVMHLLAEGSSNKEVATALGITVKT